MNVQSREKRARVTEEILNTLISLVDNEKDYEKKKKHPAAWYRKEVGQILKLSDNENPSLRSYEEHLRKIRANYKEKDPLDEHWTIGASAKYDISPEVIPTLLVIANILDQPPPSSLPAKLKSQMPLSIRQALWINRLYPLLTKVAERTKPGEIKKQYGIMFIIASQYARLERTAEIMGKQVPDTSTLDDIYFSHDKPVDVNQGFFKVVIGGE